MGKPKEQKKVVKRVRAQAKCASFDIEINAAFVSHGLAAAEVEDIKRDLKHRISEMVAKLPFAHVYPFEVRTR